ncbi:MAG: type I restriction-modification system subunit M N-terminal domain-containing protein [Erysipelotrichaceae bacterium]|nr:type I restriction-modification system subunit M N-terminal domain-containing protein [Erysipelotrichaceae bacterium]
MNKQEIAAKIWSGANALRGKVSAAKYKDYMLSLIFYKYLCNAEVKFAISEGYEEEDLKALDNEIPTDVTQMQNNLNLLT